MKKLLDLGSLTGIVIALILIGYLYLPQRPAQATSGPGGAFKDFPVGQARLINLSARREALEDLTSREQLDQMRDWLLFTAVSASGLSAEEVNKTLFDLPPIRHGYMQPVADFEYGDARSCYIGDGQVLALVPADTSDERTERLARIADAQRKNLGTLPAKLLVFEYELKPADDPAQQTATLTRRDAVNVKDLYTSSAGYSEAKLNSLDDLKRFMGQVDDLTYVSLKDGLTVGGRKIKGHDYRGLRVEEIAALYQSEAKLRGGRNTLKQKIDDYNARCAGEHTFESTAERDEFDRQCTQDKAALEAEMLDARNSGKFTDSSGFSLDPTFDYAGLAAKFDAGIAPGIRNIMAGGALADTSASTQASLFTPELSGLPGADSSVEQKIASARAGLAHKNADALFELLGEVAKKGKEGEVLARLIEDAIDHTYGYQAARYDGDLQGTEAGMVLFYTDLLAKLWAMNYQHSAPAGAVPDFRPMTTLPVASVYKQELAELSNTRLWFGPQDKGFQVADKGQSMLFARTATRVYAASSNTLKPGVEAQPNAHAAAFLGWWDEHYDEIARFEPEYERLNEIMKWSLVVTWLNQQGQGQRLNFLQNEQVERGNWFPDWVKQHPQLRYKAWDKIGFYPRGYNGTTTEALPRLTSETYRQFGSDVWLVGGVSLASEETFAERAALSADSEVVQTARRSNLNYALGESTNSALKTFDGTTYRFSNVSANEAATTATAKDGAKLRGLYGEVANEPVARTVTHTDGGLNIGARLGDVPLGELHIGNAENGFRVGWASRDMDAGATLARRLTTSSDPAKTLALDPDVSASVVLPGGRGYMVKLEGSDHWLKITPERVPSASLESGYAARVGDFDAGAQNYNLAWVNPKEATANLGESGALRLRKVAGTEHRYEMEMAARDSAGQPISIEHDGATVRGTLNPETGDVSFAYDELPQTLRDDPSLLRRLVVEANPSAGGGRYVVGEFNKSGLMEQLRSGDYRAAARNLVEAPDEFKTQLDADLRAGLEDCKGLMRNGDYELASRRIDELINIHGPREELSLHKAVAELNVRRSTRNSLAQLVTQGNRPTMLDELSARLNESLPLGRRGESVKFMRTGDDVAMRYDLSNLDGGSPLTTDDASQLKAFIYIEDEPGLNNLDWQFSPQHTLDAAISGRFKVVRLPRGDVARFKPSVIYDEAEGITFKAVNEGGTGTGFRAPRYYVGGGGGGFIPSHRRITVIPCGDRDDGNSVSDNRNCKDEDDDTAIIIVRK